MIKRTFPLELTMGDDSEAGIRASAVVPGDSGWYEGHFPGNPILPGIALLALVEEVIVLSERQAGRRVAITGLTRVRFRLPVGPGDRMEISIGRREGQGQSLYPFTIFLKGEVASVGAFRVRAEGQPLQIS